MYLAVASSYLAFNYRSNHSMQIQNNIFAKMCRDGMSLKILTLSLSWAWTEPELSLGLSQAKVNPEPSLSQASARSTKTNFD